MGKNPQLKRTQLALLIELGHLRDDQELRLYDRGQQQAVRKLVKLGLVDRIEEDGFRDSYRITEQGLELLNDRCE